MLDRFLSRKPSYPELTSSKLFNEDSFYPSLMKDLKRCKSELLIECPFVTSRRVQYLLPTLEKLKRNKVRIVVNTRDPHEQNNENQRNETLRAIAGLQCLGIHVLYTSGHHRKLVILDRSILYEGSLNVLSQNNSSEVMRRIESVALSWQMVRFIRIDDYL